MANKDSVKASSRLNTNSPSINKFSINSDFDNSLVDQLDNVFFWSSTRNGNDEEIHYSGNILRVTGYTVQEILSFPGKGIDIIFEDDRQAYKKNIFEFINNSEDLNANFIFRVVRKDKTIIWLSENITVKRNDEDKIKLINCVVTDISIVKNEEDNLRKTLVNLKQVNDSKDKFISILSHDLRAPFTSILGFSEILIGESSLSQAERNEYLSYIHESSQNQLQLINYLLDWTRLQTGRIKIEPQRLNAQTITYNCISSLTGNAIRKNLDIKVEVEETLYIQADERLITQVITNLLSNAIKFSPENKTIEISAEVFNEDLIEFIVRDYGIGISDTNKTKLFRIDRMFSTEGTKGEKGTGLGLSLVKEIIDKHNGDIWFYSEAGDGSEFHFTVPSSQNTILVVENNPADKVLFEKILKKYFPNFQVMTSENGFEAIEAISKKIPSLIITDHEMPLMNGIQLLESIRKEDSLRIPVIAILTTIADEIMLAYKELGTVSILQKPVDIELLCRNIKQAIN